MASLSWEPCMNSVYLKGKCARIKKLVSIRLNVSYDIFQVEYA